MKSIQVNLTENESQIISSLGEGSENDFIVDAVNHFAPLAVLRKRDPAAYFTVMKAAYEVAEKASWTMKKLASDEQTALMLSEINNPAIMDYYKKESKRILDSMNIAVTIKEKTN